MGLAQLNPSYRVNGLNDLNASKRWAGPPVRAYPAAAIVCRRALSRRRRTVPLAFAEVADRRGRDRAATCSGMAAIGGCRG